MKTIKVLTFLVLVSCMMSGCKPKGLEGLVPGKGEVLYDSQPLAKAVVTFSPKEGSGRAATATTDDAGKFSLGTLNPGDGIAPGEYLVSIRKYVIQNPMTDEEINAYTIKHDIPPEIISKSVIPDKYGNLEKSGLTATIPEKGATDLSFSLTP